MRKVIPWLVLVVIISVLIMNVMLINQQKKMSKRIDKPVSLDEDSAQLMSDYLASIKKEDPIDVKTEQ